MTEERADCDVDAARAVLAADKQARAVLEANRQARAVECARLIRAALTEWNCELAAAVVIDGRPVPVPVQIVAQ